MTHTIHRNSTRGGANIGWLNTKYSFSFAHWYNPERMGFGTLCVLNDDIIAPHSGFPPHGHKDMEIITLVMSGAVTHEDSLGNKEKVRAGEVQVMSAGTGVTHAEYNEEAEPLSLFQIWIKTNVLSAEPRYDQKPIPWNTTEGHTTIVGPMGSNAPLHIRQDAHITSYVGSEETQISRHTDGLYIFVVSGAVTVLNETLKERDAILIEGSEEISISPEGHVTLLCIHTPLIQ